MAVLIRPGAGGGSKGSEGLEPVSRDFGGDGRRAPAERPPHLSPGSLQLQGTRRGSVVVCAMRWGSGLLVFLFVFFLPVDVRVSSCHLRDRRTFPHRLAFGFPQRPAGTRTSHVWALCPRATCSSSIQGHAPLITVDLQLVLVACSDDCPILFFFSIIVLAILIIPSLFPVNSKVNFPISKKSQLRC